MSPEKAVLVRNLYLKMPGAPKPPWIEGEYLWRRVEGTEHWLFCAAVVDLATNAAQVYAR